MTDADLQAIAHRNAERKRLKAAATVAPWSDGRTTLGHADNAWRLIIAAPGYYIARLVQEGGAPGLNSAAPPEAEANMLFIVNARNDPVEDDIDALLAEIQGARGTI